MKALKIGLTLAAVVVVWNVATAQQEMLNRPGPGSGLTRVEGTVAISNSPSVQASQSGEWRVSLVPVPFLRSNARYLVTWPDGGTERLVITAEASHGNWVLVEGGRRWVNLAMARSVEEAR
jgi:hypothetical protein